MGQLLFASVAAVAGVLPIMSIGPMAIHLRQDVPLSDALLGAVFGIFFAGGLLGTAVGARLVGRLGITRVIAIGTAGAALSGGAVAGATASHAIGVIAVLSGVFNGFLQPGVNLYVMQVVPQRLRGVGFGLRVAGIPLATAIAAAAAGLLLAASISWRGYFVATAVLAGVLAVVALRAPPAISTEDRSTVLPREERRPATLWILSASGLLASSSTAVLAPFLVGALVWKGAAPATAALVVAVAGGTGVVTRVLMGLVADRVPSPRVHLALAAGMLIVCGAGMAMVGSVAGLAATVAGALVSYGIGWSWPGLLHYAALTMHRRAQASAAAQMQYGTFAGAILGPMTFGVLLEAGWSSLAWTGFGLLTALAAAGLITVVRMTRTS